MKEFEINIVVSNEDNKYTEDEIVDLVDDWCEQHDLTMGGGIKELKEIKWYLSISQLILLLKIYQEDMIVTITGATNLLKRLGYITIVKNHFIITEKGSNRVLRTKRDLS